MHTYEAAYDTYSIARLNYENANQNSQLERRRILLELRTRQLARDAQSLLVQGLQRRLDALTVRSPVDGMVADLAQPDQSHAGGSVPLVTVIDLSALVNNSLAPIRSLAHSGTLAVGASSPELERVFATSIRAPRAS